MLEPLDKRFKCTCMFELENKLPRTKFCRNACLEQKSITKINKDAK